MLLVLPVQVIAKLAVFQLQLGLTFSSQDLNAFSPVLRESGET